LEIWSAQIDETPLVGRALTKPARDDLHRFKFVARNRLCLIALEMLDNECSYFGARRGRIQFSSQGKSSRENHVRRAVVVGTRDDDEVVLGDDLAQPRRAVRERGQRFQVTAQTRRFLITQRGCGLVASARQIAEKLPRAPLQKSHRAAYAGG